MLKAIQISLGALILVQLQGCASVNAQQIEAENTINTTLERAFAGELAPQTRSHQPEVDTLNPR